MSTQILNNFVNGQIVEPKSGKYLDVINPATQEVIAKVPDSDAADVASAVTAARNAFPGWSVLSGPERSEYLFRIADLIEERKRDLAQFESMNQGKPMELALKLDIPRAAENFRFFAGFVRNQTEMGSQMESTGAFNYTLRRPVGVAGLISPWNLPLYLLTWKIAPAIAFGNTCVAKPSELTPVTAFMLSEILMKAELPPGVCNIVHGLGQKVGVALTSHPQVPLISFTGGTQTAESIVRESAPHFKKLSLELGGKNPNIIFADCDFDQMLENTIRSSFLNQGEICLCGSRIYVEKPLFEKFVQKFKEAAESLVVDDPLDRRTFMGPLVSRGHLEKVKSYIELAKKEGATVVTGGVAPTSLRDEFKNGNFLRPTILTGVEHTSKVIQEEIFGPVVTITPFERESEAVRFANGVKYGLSASLWTKDLTRAHRVASQLEAGTVWINCWMVRDLRMPFGGMKASGVGREGGIYSEDFFTELKTVCVKL